MDAKKEMPNFATKVFKTSINEKRSILIAIINKIVIKDNEIMIHYNSVA